MKKNHCSLNNETTLQIINTLSIEYFKVTFLKLTMNFIGISLINYQIKTDFFYIFQKWYISVNCHIFTKCILFAVTEKRRKHKWSIHIIQQWSISKTIWLQVSYRFKFFQMLSNAHAISYTHTHKFTYKPATKKNS